MNIYVMRHGTTIWNEKGICQGRSQNRLSSAGKEIVKQVAEDNKNTNFEIIFCSPLMRTMQTANIMNKNHNVKIVKDKRLIEINQGIFTGRYKNSFTKEEEDFRNRRDKSCGIESYESVYKRSEDFIQDIINNYKHENILVVTHNVSATAIEKIFLKRKVNFKDKKSWLLFDNAELKSFLIN